ncbi:MAG: LytTR family DNA-binding domain-containing protein [Paracoccaceae bacterium]
MREELRNFLLRLAAPTPVAIWIISSLTVSLAGPFGTFEALPYFSRLTYWGSVIGLSIVIGAVVRLISLSRFRSDEPVKQDILSIVAMTVIFSPIVFLLTILLVPSDENTFPSIVEVASYVAAISTAVFAIRRLLPGVDDISNLIAPTVVPPPKLLRRLPPDFVGPILRLSVRDHFVDVVTPRNTVTIRLRFSDAIEEMDGVQGYCVHRSHWVVADAIVAVEQTGGKTTVRLSNGDVVPVSRKYRENLKVAGLL